MYEQMIELHDMIRWIWMCFNYVDRYLDIYVDRHLDIISDFGLA